jgi:probable phosphoglycerate mutase
LAAIYSSDLSRAHQTASHVAQHTGAELMVEPALRERSFGSFEGKTFAEIEASLPEAARRWRQRDPDFIPEGGESLTQLQARVMGIVSSLASRHPGQLIALVSHGGVMDVLYRAATRLDLQSARTWALGNAAINRLLWSPQGLSLVGWADTGHLQEAGGLAAVRDETSS